MTATPDSIKPATQGFVYVLSNPAFDWLKIGYSKSGGEARAKILSKDTGVPLPYKCEYELEVSDARKVESLVHTALAEHRIESGKEFFDCSLEDAMREIVLNQGVRIQSDEIEELKTELKKYKFRVKVLEKIIADCDTAYLNLGIALGYGDDNLHWSKLDDRERIIELRKKLYGDDYDDIDRDGIEFIRPDYE